MIPIRWEDDTAIFNLSQIDMYGEPDYFGYTKYIVLDNVVNYVVDYKMSIERKLRPVHRYNRVDRFRFTLAQLLGAKGNVPKEILAIVQDSKADSWSDIRYVLKKNDYSRYYNRIPVICHRLGIKPPIYIKWDNALYHKMCTKFLCIQERYRTLNVNRKYFPSIRFIALKILEMFGATFEDGFKFIRTKRKLDALDDIWNQVVI